MMQALLAPFKLGPIELPNRIVVAPLTRMRTLAGNVPGPLNATYYGQRTSMGLSITKHIKCHPKVSDIRESGHRKRRSRANRI